MDKKTARWLTTLLALVLVGVTGCDDGRTTLPSDDTPQTRLVTLGGTVTEIVYSLGAGDQVVAVDQSSVYPEATEEKRRLNLFRDISAEAVLSFKPTKVVTTEAARPKEALEKIEKANVEVVRVSEAETVEGAKERITEIGRAIGRPKRARKMVRSLTSDLKQARSMAEDCESEPKTLFVYARGRGTLFVAGTDTSAATMIRMAGGQPVPTSFEDFQPLTPEAALEVDPDVVLMTTSGLKSIGGLKGLKEIKGVGQTSAIDAGRVRTMEDLKLLGFGPRLGQSIQELSRKLCQTGE
jgi:iron complex transport system substrate-binding protein